jgi:hypothetical protein
MHESTTPQPEQEPTVLEMLQARFDGYYLVFDQELDLLAQVVAQLAPTGPPPGQRRSKRPIGVPVWLP